MTIAAGALGCAPAVFFSAILGWGKLGRLSTAGTSIRHGNEDAQRRKVLHIGRHERTIVGIRDDSCRIFVIN
jgi:hypothetical protein